MIDFDLDLIHPHECGREPEHLGPHFCRPDRSQMEEVDQIA